MWHSTVHISPLDVPEVTLHNPSSRPESKLLTDIGTGVGQPERGSETRGRREEGRGGEQERGGEGERGDRRKGVMGGKRERERGGERGEGGTKERM